MVRTSLQSVAQYENLKISWEELKSRSKPKSRNTVGIDGISINDFSENAQLNLRDISWMLQRKRYTFNALSPHLFKKSNGKLRLICVPTVSDRVVQRALLNYLSDIYTSRFRNQISYGFVKKRTVHHAGKRACDLRKKHEWALKTDISSFFDRVQRVELKDKIKKVIRQRALHPLLFSVVDCEVQPQSGTRAKEIRQLGINKGEGIRQGMPLSPFFANLYLEKFDQAVGKAGYHAVRYADDLIFFADSEEQCHEIEEFCKTELSQVGLGIPSRGPASKTEIVEPGETIEFLGLGLRKNNDRYELALLSNQIQEIRTELLRLGSIEDLLSREITISRLGAAIDSRVSGYLNAYECCTNYLEFENELESIKQKILRRVFGQNGLGIDLAALTPEKKKFLGI